MGNFLSTFNGADAAFGALIILGLFAGARKGFGTMISKVLALLGSILTVLHYYSPVARWVSEKSVLPRQTAEVVFFVLIGVGAWILLNLIMKLIEKFMEVKFSEGIKRFGGLLLGGVFFYVAAGFIIYGLLIFHIPGFKAEWIAKSKAAPIAIQIPSLAYKTVFGKLPPQPSVSPRPSNS